MIAAFDLTQEQRLVELGGYDLLKPLVDQLAGYVGSTNAAAAAAAGTAKATIITAGSPLSEEVRGLAADVATANGAVTYEASGASGVSTKSGGLRIPAGQTGAGSTLTFTFDVPASRVAQLAGQKMRFQVDLLHNGQFSLLRPSVVVEATQTGGGFVQASGVTANEPSSTLLWCEVIAPGSRITLKLKVPDNASAQSADLWVFGSQQRLIPLGASAARVTDDLVVAPKNRLRAVLRTPSPTLSNGGQAMATPAVSDGATDGVIIPAGSSGNLTAISRWASISDLGYLAGQIVRVTAEFITTPYLLDPATGWAPNLAASRDGVNSQTSAVAGSAVITTSNTNRVRAQWDYVVTGAKEELVGVRSRFNGAASTELRSAYLTSLTIEPVGVVTTETRLAERLGAATQTSGNLLGTTGAVQVAAQNGAVATGPLSFAVPEAGGGGNSYILVPVLLEGTGGLAGTVLNIRATFAIPDDVPASLLGMGCRAKIYNSTARPPASGAEGLIDVPSVTSRVTKTATGAGRRTVEWLVPLTGDELRLEPYLILGTLAARATPAEFALETIEYSAEAAYGATRNPANIAAAAVEAFAYRGTRYTKTVTVAADGSGNFTTIAAAFALIGPGESTTRRTKVLIKPGTYPEVDLLVPPNVDLVGGGRPEEVIIAGAMPDDTVPADITNHQTIFANFTTLLRNLTIAGRNMRYPLHIDAGAADYRAIIDIENCVIEHFGNEGARAYQTGLGGGGNPSAVPASGAAFGMGTHSGMRFRARDTVFKSLSIGAFYHNNANFADLVEMEFENCDFVATANSPSFGITALGSGQRGEIVRLRDCRYGGPISLSGDGQVSTRLDNQQGNPWEIEARFYGPKPPAWFGSTTNQVLALRSPAGASSAVAISGSGAAVLFGVSPDIRKGGVGLGAALYSAHRINNGGPGVPVSLSARLGDRTGAPLSLTVTFDGGEVTRTISLAANYTSQGNSTVRNNLAAALDLPAGYSIEIATPYSEAAIMETDCDFLAINADTTAILRWSALAFAGADDAVRLMTSADPTTLFAGFAQQDAVVGERLRVLGRGGQIVQDHALWQGTAPTFAYGDTAGVSAVAGRLVKNSGPTVLRCSKVDGATVKTWKALLNIVN